MEDTGRRGNNFTAQGCAAPRPRARAASPASRTPPPSPPPAPVTRPRLAPPRARPRRTPATATWGSGRIVITRTAHSEALIVRGTGYDVDRVRSLGARRPSPRLALDQRRARRRRRGPRPRLGPRGCDGGLSRAEPPLGRRPAVLHRLALRGQRRLLRRPLRLLARLRREACLPPRLAAGGEVISTPPCLFCMDNR